MKQRISKSIHTSKIQWLRFAFIMSLCIQNPSATKNIRYNYDTEVPSTC